MERTEGGETGRREEGLDREMNLTIGMGIPAREDILYLRLKTCLKEVEFPALKIASKWLKMAKIGFKCLKIASNP